MGISLFKRKCYNKKCSRSFHKNSGIFFSTFSEYIFTLPLNRLHLDIEAAINYCGGDESLYKDILSDFTEVFSERKAEMDGYFQEKDWHEFEVKVHATKSAAKTIGAMELSEKALSLEKAAEKQEADFIKKTYPAFMLEYQDMVFAIKEVLKAG